MAWQGYESPYSQTVPASVSAERATFIRRTYAHLAGALAAFLLLEILLFQTSLPALMLDFAAGGRFNWLMILGGFVLVGWLARAFAANHMSLQAQYVGLGLYVVAEAIIFMPLILIALLVAGSPNILVQAAVMTATLFTGLTAVVFITGKDFNFLRSFLVVGGMIAIGLIVSGAIFGFDLGLAFSGGMIVLASASILYDTSKILREYQADQYVGAALELFASVALLLWYVLRILIRLRR